MTQEEKQLLLKDLSARLLYGVIIYTEKGDGHLCSINQTLFGVEYGVNVNPVKRDYFNDRDSEIKPYLRPMSSMTDEEEKEFNSFVKKDFPNSIIWSGDNVLLVEFEDFLDWLNSHHFDFRNLIEKGLALEAKEGMYET